MLLKRSSPVSTQHDVDSSKPEADQNTEPTAGMPARPGGGGGMYSSASLPHTLRNDTHLDYTQRKSWNIGAVYVRSAVMILFVFDLSLFRFLVYSQGRNVPILVPQNPLTTLDLTLPQRELKRLSIKRARMQVAQQIQAQRQTNLPQMKIRLVIWKL